MLRTKLSQQTSPMDSYKPELYSQIVAVFFLADVPETPPLIALTPEPELKGRPEIPLVTKDVMEIAGDRTECSPR